MTTSNPVVAVAVESKVRLRRRWSIKVQYSFLKVPYLHSVLPASLANLWFICIGVDNFAQKEGVPSAADGAINKEVNSEMGKFT